MKVQQIKDGAQKLLKQSGLFKTNLPFLLCASLLQAENFENFHSYKSTQQKSYQKFADARDNGFGAYLQEQFKEYKAHIGEPFYEEPKPKQITPMTPQNIKAVGPKIFLQHPSIKETPAKKIPVEILKKEEKKKDIEFDFYGTSLAFDVDEKIRNTSFYPQTQVGIGTFFNAMAASAYAPLVADINAVIVEMQLNDWGVYLLVDVISKKVYKDEDAGKLFAWFIFNKLGYDARVGLAQKKITLMHYSQKDIYDTPNYSFGGKKFYALSEYAKGKAKPLYSYEKSYPNAIKALDLSLEKLPKLTLNEKRKTLRYQNDGKSFAFDYIYNQNLIDFMGTYPQADYEIYFNTPMDSISYNSLLDGLQKEIDGKSASLALNFILNFVQNAFIYEVDQTHFGREKVMFAQETLFFDKSDCEDRSILFASLVKDFFGYGVVGIKYKNHMATGLYIPMLGDSVEAAGRRFVIADPTYINATIGQSMPKYLSQTPERFIIVKK